MNRSIHGVLAASLLLAAGAVTPASAQEPTPAPARARKQIDYKPRFAKDFAFLEIGKTTPDEAKGVLGDTKWEYRSYIIENEMVIDLGLADLVKLYERAGSKPVEEVWVQTFTAGEDGHKVATLVYEKGTLLWAHFPAAKSEETRAKIAASWGKTPVAWKKRPLRGDPIVHSPHLLRIPGENVFYFEDCEGRYMYKVVHAPQVDVTWGWEPGDLGEPKR